MELALPQEAVTAIKCGLCHQNLSVPPIVAIALDGSQYRCGRCEEVDCKTFMRNYCFENVAKFLTFPCTYRHCTEKVPWGQVEQHERICPHKTLPCPMFYQGCMETVEAKELWMHFTQYHRQNVKYDEIVTSLKVNEFVVYLLAIKAHHFVVYICVNDREPSYVSVFSITPEGAGQYYNLELNSMNSTASIHYRNQRVQFFDERQHCLKCNEKECWKRYHPYSMVYDKQGENREIRTTDLKVTSIIDVLEQPESIIFTIHMEKDEGIAAKKQRTS